MEIDLANIKIKLKKFEFFTQKIRYLGQIIETGLLSIGKVVFKALKDVEYTRTKQ